MLSYFIFMFLLKPQQKKIAFLKIFNPNKICTTKEIYGKLCQCYNFFCCIRFSKKKKYHWWKAITALFCTNEKLFFYSLFLTVCIGLHKCKKKIFIILHPFEEFIVFFPRFSFFLAKQRDFFFLFHIFISFSFSRHRFLCCVNSILYYLYPIIKKKKRKKMSHS